MISHPANIEAIVEALTALAPPRILDVGCGFGKWGLIAREAAASIAAEAGDLTPDPMALHVHAIENASYFRTVPWLEAIYDQVTWGDVLAMDIGALTRHVDAVLLIDVIEHWPKETGTAFLDACRAPVIVSTPREVVFYDQDYYGPDCPHHETQWSAADFARWPVLRDDSTETSHILTLGPR